MIELINIIAQALALMLLFCWTLIKNRLSPFIGDHWVLFGVTFINSKHLFVVNEYLWRQAFNDPVVHQSFKRCDSLFWIPFKAAFDKILE